jgi:hypothetical protein
MGFKIKDIDFEYDRKNKILAITLEGNPYKKTKHFMIVVIEGDYINKLKSVLKG